LTVQLRPLPYVLVAFVQAKLHVLNQLNLKSIKQ
jgi:hypothetical protein